MFSKAFAAAFMALYMPSEAYACTDWSTRDTVALTASTTLYAVDWGQTRTIARNPDKYREKNPILGPHPSTGQVDRYFTGLVIGHAVVACMLPKEYRQWWLWGNTASQLNIVMNNRELGLSLSFNF